MPIHPEIIKSGLREWENRHLTFTQKVDDVYDMWNARTGDAVADYNAMTGAVQQFLRESAEAGACVRALGAGWSWTRIAATEGRMLNTKGLNLRFNIPQASVSPLYQKPASHLLFAQCGNSVKELFAFLQRKNQTLCTSGASNGQTIVGAISTGTHGSAFDFGAVPEFVVGLHIIVGPDRHVWLERASRPVIADDLAATLGAELLRDDELFNAALVSFGNFGFIHGVMLETEDLFLLECHRQRLPFDSSLRNLMQTLDFEKYEGLPNGHERPQHLQVLLNPYDLKRGAHVNTMYKRPYRTDYEAPEFKKGGYAAGDDAPVFMGNLTDTIPLLTPMLVNKILKITYKPYSNVLGTPGEIFTNTTTRGKVLSAAMGFPLEAVNQVTDLLLALNRSEGPFNGAFAYRYVKASSATLGFTRFAPVTCVMEMDGLYSERNLQFCQKVWNALDRERIPYTFHWGKVCGMNPERLKTMYGERAEAWMAARQRLLSPECQAVFSNDQAIEWGLCAKAERATEPIPA
jgi:hypothetical protein